MRFGQLTTGIQNPVRDAHSLALHREHSVVKPVHMLFAMIDQADGTVPNIFAVAVGNFEKIRHDLNQLLDQLPQVTGGSGQLMQSRDLQGALNATDKLAQEKGDSYIASELLVLALFKVRDPLSKVLTGNGVTRESLEATVERVRKGAPVEDPCEKNRGALSKYTIDLTVRAVSRELDPVNAFDPIRLKNRVPALHDRI